jgi:hypothetical protein
MVPEYLTPLNGGLLSPGQMAAVAHAVCVNAAGAPPCARLRPHGARRRSETPGMASPRTRLPSLSKPLAIAPSDPPSLPRRPRGVGAGA